VIRFPLAGPAAAFAAAAALALAVPARAAEVPIPPAPQRWVTDNVALLSPGVLEALDRQLEAYERQTGHQVLVWIGATTGDTPLEEFAVKAFEKWKPGRTGQDDGLVFFLFTQDRKMKIEVGYGLEDRVTDLTASRVFREVVAPRLQGGDPDGALREGVAALLSAIDAAGTEAVPAPAPGPGPRPLSTAQKVVIAVVVLGFLLLLLTNPSLAIWLLMNVLSGSGRGGGRSEGGGWSGGGGRSGGGGATGSW
jgi:uncharacterized protein